MRIKRLTIFNFKNFLGKVEFNLDKKMTIIYGENGFGKSSFFDALEWGITGKISRFTTNNSDGDFNDKFLLNSDIVSSNQNKECYVEILLDNYILHRKIVLSNDSTRATVELRNIESGEIVSGKHNVESKLKLMFLPDMVNSTFNLKQPYILSQDQVTDFILKDNPKDKYKALASLVGLEKIINYSHNIRLIKKDLNGKKEKLENLIVSKQELKNAVITQNHYTKEYLNTKIQKLNLNNIDNLTVLLNETRDEISNKIYEYKNKIQVLSPYNNENKSIQELMNENEKLLFKINRLKKHIEYVKSSNDFLSNKISELELFENNGKKLGEYIQKSLELDVKIKGIKSSLELMLGSNTDISLNEVDKKLSELNERHSFYNYNFTYQEEYILGKENALKLSNEMEINQDIILKLNRKVQRKKDRLKKIDNLLYESGTHTNETKIYELITNIKEFIENKKEKDICPVCSSNLNGNLINKVERNRENLENIIIKSTHRFQKILDIKNSIENSLNQNEVELEKLIKVNEKTQVLINGLEKRINDITNNEMFDSSVINQNKELINLEIIRINNIITNLNAAKNNLIDLSSLENQKNNYNLNISKMQQVLDNEGALKLGYYRDKFTKRNIHLSSLNKELLNDEKKYKDESNKISLLINYKIEIEIPLKILYGNFVKEINLLQIKLEEVNLLNQEYWEFEKEKDRRTIQEKAIGEINKAQSEVEYINNNIQVLENFVEEINSTIGLEALSFLNKENSTVQQIYRYLNPMVGSKSLKFIAEEESLIIKILDENNVINKEMNAQYVLSSGQLNVLALSIFLAMNKTTESPFELVAIDDPIQNMDDVNQFAVCDVLSSINKQLIFSTHDLDFVKLFAKKNDHLEGHLQVYLIKRPKIKKNEDIEHIVFERKDIVTHS